MKPLTEIILSNLMCSTEFVNEFINHIEVEFFQDPAERVVFTEIKNYWTEFKQLPNKNVIGTMVSSHKDITEFNYKSASDLVTTLSLTPDPTEWLFASTDKWITESAFSNSLRTIIHQLSTEGKKKKRDPVELITEALTKGRQQSLGLRLSDIDALHAVFQQRDIHMPFLLNTFNAITGGGLVRQRMLNIVAPTGVGKTLFMCNFAAEFVKQGFHVLYVTFEMPEADIMKRIDANLLDLPVDSLSTMTLEQYRSSKAKLNLVSEVTVTGLKQKTQGIKDIASLLTNMKRRNQRVDILMVDYLTLCGSAYYEKPSQYVSKHTVVSSVAEELVQVCKQFNVAGITAQQMNREGMKASTPGMEHVADSIAAIHPMDTVVIVTEDEHVKDTLKISVVKNRQGSKSDFMVQVDYPRMKLIDSAFYRKGVSESVKAFMSQRKAAGGAALELVKNIDANSVFN